VRLVEYEEYREEGKAVGCTIGRKPRWKIRLALGDRGVSIRESETPELFLIRLYDLLEALECLHQRGVLHREVSANNVLFRDGPVAYDKSRTTFCSARHLLDSTEERTTTDLVLIDGEYGTEEEKQKPSESAGTPLYQARASIECRPMALPKGGWMPGMPKLKGGAETRYSEAWPDRLNRFPSPGQSIVIYNGRAIYLSQLESNGPQDWDEKGDQSETEEKEKEEGWYHELRHDVESVSWILIVWALELRPDNGGNTTEIPHGLWTTLVSTESREDVVDIVAKEKKGWLDPKYQPMESLIEELAQHLLVDLHWLSTDKGHPKEMKDPSYLREVFQRCILNFLVKNRGETFMTQKRHQENRRVEKFFGEESSLTSRQISERQSQRSSARKRGCDETERQGSSKRRRLISTPTPAGFVDREGDRGRSH
jgi:serine/threonine protein kinase